MKREKRPLCFKERGDKFKKIKLKKDRLILPVLVMGGILTISLLGFYFKFLIEKERLEVRKDLERILLEVGPILPEKTEPTSPETLFELKETGIVRYFLSEIELIGGYYTPTVHLCLFERGRPIYPLYVYETWSLLTYPEKPPPRIALIRYLLLPRDNSDFQPDKTCFIKEIKTEKDWQELGEKYGFSRDQF